MFLGQICKKEQKASTFVIYTHFRCLNLDGQSYVIPATSHVSSTPWIFSRCAQVSLYTVVVKRNLTLGWFTEPVEPLRLVWFQSFVIWSKHPYWEGGRLMWVLDFPGRFFRISDLCQWSLLCIIISTLAYVSMIHFSIGVILAQIRLVLDFKKAIGEFEQDKGSHKGFPW